MFVKLEKGTVLKKDDALSPILFNILSPNDILKDDKNNFYYISVFKRVINLETEEEKEFVNLFDNAKFYTVVKTRGDKQEVYNKEELDKIFAKVMLALPAIVHEYLTIEDMKSLRSYLQQRYDRIIEKNFDGQEFVNVHNLVYHLQHRSFSDGIEEKWSVSLDSITQNPDIGITADSINISFKEFVDAYSDTVIDEVVNELEMLIHRKEDYYESSFNEYFTDEYYNLDELNRQIEILD